MVNSWLAKDVILVDGRKGLINQITTHVDGEMIGTASKAIPTINVPLSGLSMTFQS